MDNTNLDDLGRLSSSLASTVQSINRKVLNDIENIDATIRDGVKKELDSESLSDPDTYDVVKRPQHYNYSNIQPKDVIRDWDLNFNLGSAVKYMARAGHKDDIVQDLSKAVQFIKFEYEYVKDIPSYNDPLTKADTNELIYKREEKYTIEEVCEEWKLDTALSEAISSIYIFNAINKYPYLLLSAVEQIETYIHAITIERGI